MPICTRFNSILSRLMKLWLWPSLLLVLTPICIFADSLDLPDIGDSSRSVISPAEERKLGDLLIRQLRQQMNIIEEPEINEYIVNLGYELVAQLETLNQSYTFLIVDSPAINAFALPGGYIVVHSGLFRKTTNESQLAAVLAHEIAHISQNHIARAIERSNVTNLSVLAGVMAAIVLAKENPELAQATISAAIAASIQNQLKYTRENELEADRVGIKLMVFADFNPYSIPEFFKLLYQESQLHGGQGPEFLRTHPVTATRIADAQNRAKQFDFKSIRPSNIEYYLMRTKLEVMTGLPGSIVDYFKKSLEDASTPLEKTYLQYGLAMSYLQDFQAGKAHPIMQSLLKRDPYRLPYQTALAKIELERGKIKEALSFYDSILALNPDNCPATVYYSEALLQAGKARKAARLMRQHIRRYEKKDVPPVLYKLLARAEGEAGFLFAAYRAQAEYYFSNGQTRDAIEQLNSAKKIQDLTEYQRSSVEARLKDFKEIFEEEEG